MDDLDLKIAGSFARGMKPIPNMTVSEWANSFRMLSKKGSSKYGRYNINYTPYLREIMDHLGKTSDMQEIVFKKGSQIGATETSLCFVGYSIHINPSIILLVMPKDDDIKKVSSTRITPMIQETPVLNERVKPAGNRDSKNTINMKEFEGGVLMMVGSNSPSNLASTPAAKILLDEVDRMPKSSGGEGSPIDLARARARTFSDRKIFMISTPVLEGESMISEEFEDGDCKYYNVPCLHCDELFVIDWRLITYNEDLTEVRCACPHCGGLHEDKDKTIMLKEEGFGGRAKWIATRVPKNKRKTSYHLSALYSPPGMYSWTEVVIDFLKAEGNETKMQTFVNTVLGETYKVTAEVPDQDALYDRREQYEAEVPAGVYFLTMGVDTQNDRLEYVIRGWGKERENWVIKYGVLTGDTAADEVWGELSAVVNSELLCYDGAYMGIRQTAIDSGGHRTQKVYDFAKKHGYSKVVPVRGLPQRNTGILVHNPKATTITKAGKKIGSAKVWGVDTYMLKEELYSTLRLTSAESGFPPGYVHFSTELERYFFKMLTAEELRLQKNAKGYDEWQWVKVFERNEALDVMCYARAAAWVVGMDRFTDSAWDKMRQVSVKKAVFEAVIKSEGSGSVKKPTNKGGWFDRRR